MRAGRFQLLLLGWTLGMAFILVHPPCASGNDAGTAVHESFWRSPEAAVIMAVLILLLSAALALTLFFRARQRVTAALALKASEQRLRTIMDNAPVVLWAIDGSGVFTFADGRGLEDLRLASDGLVGRSVFDVFSNNKAQMENFRRVLSGEEVNARIGVEDLVYEARYSPLQDQAGRVIGAKGVAVDVTAREKLEAWLRESESKFATAFRSKKVAISISRLSDGRFVEVNPGFVSMYGYAAEEAVGRTLDDLDLLGGAKHLSERRAARLEEEGQLRDNEFSFRRKNGERGTGINSSELIVINGEKHVLSISLDITENKKSEEERNRLTAVVEHLDEEIVITDPEGCILYVNPAFERVTGYLKPEVVGGNPRLLKSGRHDEPFYRNLWTTIKAGDVWRSRITNRAKDGRLIEEEATISPVFDDSSRIRAFVSVKRDVTSQIRMEAQLRQSQKMEAIGTLAGGIAHDFNNILTIITGYTQLALQKTGDTDLRKDLKQVMSASLRAMDLVKQILAFSRQAEQDRRPLDVRHVAKDALKLLRASFPSTIEMKQDITAEQAMVDADPVQIHQLIMNLCLNANQAMGEGGGLLGVALDNVELRRGESEAGNLPSGRYVRLTVSDTGPGIEPELQERIFEPYFTTKGVGEGSGRGLGLAIVHGIAKSHGGAVNVYSEVGRGATFVVFLPLLESDGPLAEEISVTPQGGSERLMFVDDEPALAEAAREMLEGQGYEVSIFMSSSEAWRAFESSPDSFDLVITDQTMPVMKGMDLAGRIHGLRPETPIILCSGFSSPVSEEEAAAAGIREFLMKPFLLAQMSKTVRRVLDLWG